jgi:membrane fusion protein (multidrug efflux system)
MSFDESEPSTAGDTGDVSNQGTGGTPGRDADGNDKRSEPADDQQKGPGDKADQKDQKGGTKDEGKDDGKPRSKKPLIILAIIVVVLGIVGFIWWFLHRNEVTTDDAYTDGNTVTMVPKVSGYVVALYIDDNSRVKRGDLLLRIDARDYQASRAEAQAQVALATAQLQSAETSLAIARVQYPAQLRSAKAQREAALASAAQARAQFLRQHEVDRRATTQENIDVSTSQELNADANVANADAQLSIADLVPQQVKQAEVMVAERRAQLDSATAQLAQAELNVGYTEIRAPVDGFVTLRSVQFGSYVTAGQSMFILVTPQVWVTANYKESQIGRMRPGDPVDISIDAYSSLHLHGHVQSIQYGSGSRFSAFPAENATGNFVKIVQRVPVKIVIDDGLDPDRPLPLGMSVSPDVHFP